MKSEDRQLTEITIKVSRVPAVIFGILGVAASVVLIISLAVYGSQILRGIIEFVSDYTVLLIVAASIAIAAVGFIVLTILIISTISIWGRFNKGLRAVLFTFLITAIFLLIAAAVVGAVWLTLPR